MKIENPYFSVRSNIFEIREKEFLELEGAVAKMLEPALDLGFTIKDFGLKDYKFYGGELQRSLRKSLVIELQKGNSDPVVLTSYIPKLIDKNYIMISGRRKLPQFQLFDIPIVTRGKMIKLRTNVVSLTISDTKEKDPDYVFLSIFNKKVPFSLVLLAKYGIDEVKEKFHLDDISRKKPISVYEKLLEDLFVYCEESSGYTKEDFTLEVGRYFSNYDIKTKGEDILYAIDIIPKVDIMSAKFFRTNNVYDELIEAMKVGQVDDTDFQNKRIRCFEYAVLAKIAKDIYNLCITCRTQANPKFNTNSKQIIQDCNVSTIVQFDFSINPIEELTRLARVSLVGPGGFTRENVPQYLRDICPSMFGRLCSVDTPDRENCGILQNLLPNTSLDENLRFTSEIDNKATVSFPVSMVPFLEHDDQTRLQMASSQMRQSVMLMNFDKPLIKSGCEDLYTHNTQFVKVAKKDGEVIYCDENYVVVMYDDKDVDVFDIAPRKIYVENLDIMRVYVDVGKKVKRGEIIAESNFCKEGSIQFGKNYRTVFTSYHGFNYEDSIVISERLQDAPEFTSVHFADLSFVLPPNKVLLSLNGDEYKPLPFLPALQTEENGTENGSEVEEKFKLDCIMPGQPYAISKEIPSGPLDYGQVFEEEIKMTTKRQVFVHSVNIYPNTHNTTIKEFDSWVNQVVNRQQEKEKKFQRFLYEIMPKEKATQFIRDNCLDKFSHIGKYRIKGEEINGMYVEVFGTYKKPIESGDKIGNRHGNKGVVKILPHKLMPQLPDGSHADICVNPLSVFSRMNIGQIFELHLAASLVDLKKNMLEMLRTKKPQKVIKKYLLDYIKLVDRTENSWYYTQFEKGLPKTIDEKFVTDLSLIQAPFESANVDMIIKAMEYTRTPMKIKIFDPIYNQEILNPVSWGYLYFFRMVHIAETRLAARGIAAYSRRTLQPPGGRKNKGGQRIGEMETCCFIAHGSSANLHECMTTKSDCTDLKNEYIRQEIESDFVRKPEKIDSIPESVKLLNAYLLVAGVKKDD